MENFSPARAAQFSPTAVVLLNLGGPESLDAVHPFLLKLFSDHEIISLPCQSVLGPLIAGLRAPAVRARYAEIGGGSPLLRWTKAQGEGLTRRLDALALHTAPHRFYVAFRYAAPLAEDVLLQMKADGVRRVILFSQYPFYSCATTGSSLNEFWRAAARLGLKDEFVWSVIDRWPVHPGFVGAVAQSIRQGLCTFPEEERKDALILFSAHSLPVKFVRRGDVYPQEVGAGVQAVMQALNFSHEYILSYQSKVGPVRWLEPGSGAVLRRLGQQKRRSVLVVPLGFTSDHIETLHEIDIEYKELAERCGIRYFRRAPSLNDAPPFLDALADIVARHLHAS